MFSPYHDKFQNRVENLIFFLQILVFKINAQNTLSNRCEET